MSEYFMMTSSNGNIFRVTGPLCGEFTGRRWVPRTKASDAELWCFFWSAPWINDWVNNREAGDLRRHLAQYDAIVMLSNEYMRVNCQLTSTSNNHLSNSMGQCATERSQIARFMGPTGGPPGDGRTQLGPMPHEPCYQGCYNFADDWNSRCAFVQTLLNEVLWKQRH